MMQRYAEDSYQMLLNRLVQSVRGKAEILYGKELMRAVQDAKHRLLPGQKRQGRQPEIDGAAPRRLVGNAPILRCAALHALKMRHDLQARKQKRMNLPREQSMRFQ